MENNSDYGDGFDPSQEQGATGSAAQDGRTKSPARSQQSARSDQGAWHDQSAQSRTDGQFGQGNQNAQGGQHGQPGYGYYAPQYPRGNGNDGISRFFGWIRRSGLIRGNNRWIGGVCDGIAMRYDVSVVFVRVVLATATLVCGAGLAFYAAAWALLPDCRDGRIMGEDLVHGQWQWVFLGPIICLILGMSSGVGVFFGILAIGLLLLMINMLVNRVETGRDSDSGWYPQRPGGDGTYESHGPCGPKGYAGPASGTQSWSGPVSQPQPQSQGAEGFAGSDSRQGAQPRNRGAEPCYAEPATAGSAGAYASNQSQDLYAYQPAPGASYAYQAPPMYRAAAPEQTYAKPVIPRRLRRKPAGFVVVLLMLGLILVSGAVAVLAAIGHSGLESTLKVATIWIAVVLAALGLATLVLGIAGRRAGGLHPMIWIGAFLALALIGTDAGYSWFVNDMHRLNDSWHQVSLSGFKAVDGGDKAQLVRLRRGVAVTGNDLDQDTLNVDFSDYAKTAGTHDLELTDGSTVKSPCPTGRIDMTAQRSQVFVTLPAGCSYNLTTASDDQLRFKQQWQQYNQSGSGPMGLNMHFGWDGGSVRISPGDRNDSRHSTDSDNARHSAGRHHDHNRDRNDDDDDLDDSDGKNENSDDDDSAYCADDFIGFSIGCMPYSSFGVKSIGGRYAAIRYGTEIGMGNGRGVSIGSMRDNTGKIQSDNQNRNDKDYSWYYDRTKMPKDGPELTIVVPFVVEGKVTVQYPGESHVPSYAQYIKERN
jgi:phage shock protein PspC (stress-responsive transcriptional regulator)